MADTYLRMSPKTDKTVLHTKNKYWISAFIKAFWKIIKLNANIDAIYIG